MTNSNVSSDLLVHNEEHARFVFENHNHQSDYNKLHNGAFTTIMKCNISEPKVSISIRVFPHEKEELLAIAQEEDDSIDRIARLMLREGIKARTRQKLNAGAAEMEFVT